jgi:calpain-15
MAEFPELIRAIFVTDPQQQSEQEVGLYTLVFYKNGVRQVVKIDDYIPCTPTEGPVYSRGNGPELWVMLIEKAYAKVLITFSSLYFTSHHTPNLSPSFQSLAPRLVPCPEYGLGI